MIFAASLRPLIARTRWLTWALTVSPVLVALAGWAQSPPACSDPCLNAARGERKDCVSSAGGAFQDALDGCLERDRVCLDACRMLQRDCRDATDLDAALAACQAAGASDKERCNDTFPLGSKKWDRCVDRAQVDGFKCRRGARRDRRRELKKCRRALTRCARGCGPGAPPGGARQCRKDAKNGRVARLHECKTDFQLSVSACLDKDAVCVHDCGDQRDLCRVPVAAVLDAALAACKAQRDADVAQCLADNPGGGTALDDCIQTAQANAFGCSDAALESAGPGFAACTMGWATCIGGCPAS